MRGCVVWTLCLLLLGAWLYGPRPGALADEDAPEPPGLAAAVAFFDGLGWPDPAAHRFVRVWTGFWEEDAEGRKRARPIHGLLLSEGSGCFRILSLHLGRVEFETSAPDEPAHERVAFEEMTLATYIADALARWKAQAECPPHERRGPWRFGPHLQTSSEMAVLAWIAAKRGLAAEAEAVWAAWARMGGDEPYLVDVTDDVRTVAFWRIVESFKDPETPLSEILEQVRAFRRVFPDRPGEPRPRAMEEMLAAQLAAAPVSAPSTPAPPEELVAWLIDQLPTQHGVQFGQPGWCDVFADARGARSPAQRLVDLGYDAVPALIEALQDLRFTRSVAYFRGHFFSHHVLRVCDVALTVLSVIAGEGFWDPPYFSESVSQEAVDSRAAVQARVRDWWEDARAQGEVAMLEAKVGEGGPFAAPLARRLLAKDPLRGLAALRAGIAATSDPTSRGHLVAVLGDLESDVAAGPLREILNEDASLEVRTKAAFLLLSHDPATAITAMLAEEPEESDAYLEFLIGCGDVLGIGALEAHLAAVDAPRRVHILTRLSYAGWTAPYVLRNPSDTQELAPPAVRAAVEALLVRRLTDRTSYEVPTGLFSSVHDRFVEPRVGDYAAWVLAELFGDEYGPFDPGTTLRRRERRIAEMRNVRRAKDGDEPLPVPGASIPPYAPGVQGVVARVVFDPRDAAAWGPLGARLEALVGTKLEAAAVIQVVREAVAHLDASANAFRLHVHRDEPHLGIVVKARLFARPRGHANAGLSHAARIRVGTRNLGGHAGSSVRSYGGSREAWEATEALLEALLASPPEAILDAKIDLALFP